MARGFTIVELLIVIIVIGILASITVVAYNGAQTRAKNISMESTVSQYYKMILAYHAMNAHLPYPPRTVMNGQWRTTSFCLAPRDTGYPDNSLSASDIGYMRNSDTYPAGNPKGYGCYSGANGGTAYTSTVVYDSLKEFGKLPDASTIKVTSKGTGFNTIPIYTYVGASLASPFNSASNPNLNYIDGVIDGNGTKLSRVFITYALQGDQDKCGLPYAQKYEKMGGSDRVYSDDGLTGCVIFLDGYSNEKGLAFSQP